MPMSWKLWLPDDPFEAGASETSAFPNWSLETRDLREQEQERGTEGGLERGLLSKMRINPRMRHFSSLALHEPIICLACLIRTRR
jgi:hypothetical protein